MICLKNCLVNSFQTHGEKTAITFFRNGIPETELSYADLDSDSNRMVHSLFASGLKKGDRVIMYMPKSVAFIVAYIAIQKTGAIAVPMNPGFRQSEMAYMLEDTGAKLVIAGTGQADIIKEVAPDITTLIIDTDVPYHQIDFTNSSLKETPETEAKPDDPAVIIYTSGTTGKPKGAVHTQASLLNDAENIINIWEITSSDVLCHALPLFHIHGLCFALHTALLAGGHVVMLDTFSPEIVIDRLKENTGAFACTTFMAVPAMYVKLMDCLKGENHNFNHIRLWASGSAPLLPLDFERIRQTFGKKPVEREGMSETGMNFSNPLNGLKKSGSIGLPLPGLDVRVVSPETLTDVSPGQVGEFWLKSQSIISGYWQKPEETAKTFHDGWFRTGDLGHVDEDRYYFLTDRIKNIIISGGENISPKEVETVINQLDDVIESSVVGIPDEKWGEKVVAAVKVKPDGLISEEDIKSQCKEHLHQWKCPKQILFVKDLPKNRMGKILKKEVQALF
ncbi:MAG: acyl--CoA ligase [Desulfobacterales bacterium]|nr:acyl--CoA ligase [Desulfobacterales bacterium]